MVGLQIVQHPHQALRWQLWHDSVDDQKVVETLALLIVGQVATDQEDQVLHAAGQPTLLHSLQHNNYYYTTKIKSTISFDRKIISNA